MSKKLVRQYQFFILYWKNIWFRVFYSWYYLFGDKTMQKRKVCAITGRRNIPTEYKAYVYHKLMLEILDACQSEPCTFLCGFANGVDIMAAEYILSLKEKGFDVKLIAYLPYKDRKDSKRISENLEMCDDVIVCSDYYFKGCFIRRDKVMVDSADMLIAVTDGKDTGGTAYTIKCAEKRGIPVVKILME